MYIRSNSILRHVAIAAALGIACFGNAIAADNASAVASATVYTPIAISKTTDLKFGNILSAVGTGTVAISTTGSPSLTTVTRPGANIGPLSAAAFTVTGQATAGGNTFGISLEDTIDLSDGSSHTMAVDTFTLKLDSTTLTPSVGSGATTASATLAAGGSSTLYVGGTLNVGAGQVAGAYTGSIHVTVAYN
jgi:hypothetical protein